MEDLSDLVEMQHDDPEYVPDILPVDARLSIHGDVSSMVALFERAAAIAPTREVIPGTAFSLLEAFSATSRESSYVRITASDGEQVVSTVSGDLTVRMDGAVLIPAKRVLDILKLAYMSEASLEVVGAVTNIRSGRAQWTIQMPVGDTLTNIPDVSDIELGAVPVKPFLEAIVATRKAATSKRASLTQLQVRAGTITGCSEERLHQVKMPDVALSLNVAIPVRVVDELIKTLRATESESFEMGYDDFHLVFRIDQNSIIAQRLLLKFPSVEGLMLGAALSNPNKLSTSPSELANVIKRVRVNADPDYSGVLLTVVPGRKDAQGETEFSLAVRTRDRIGNSAQEVIACQWEGSAKGTEVSVSHHALSDFLSVYRGGVVTFKLGNDTKSVKSPLFVEGNEQGITAVIQQLRFFSG